MATSLMVLARLSGLLVAVLVLVWALGFRTSFLPHHTASSSSSGTSHLDHLYSALHPLLMVIGFILLSGEAILVHRWMLGSSRGTRKAAHLWLQGAALSFGSFGVWARFRRRNGVFANFYSLHSWMGLLCLFLFAAQWMLGFLSFWHHGERRSTRTTVLPWHVFIGLYTYGLAVVTAETGLVEKLAFLQIRHQLAHRASESILINSIGISLVMVCGIVIFAAVSPKHKQATHSSNHQINYRKSSSDGDYISYQRLGVVPSDDANVRWISS